MEFLTCRSCGSVATAYEKDGALVPLNDDCPDCGSREFDRTAVEAVVLTDE